MSKEKRRVPKLRFPGFTEDWEQRKLEDICSYQSSSLTINDIDENGQYDLYDANSLIGKTNKGYMKMEYITIIKDGAGVGRTRMLPKNSMFLGTMGALTPKNKCLGFLYQLVTNANLGKICTGSTIPHIYFKDYGKLKFCIPSIIEQEVIGKFFNNIDYLITLHQCKLEHLNLKKKALLQKLFPKNGECYPELRFPGFTDAWEQCKLDDIAKIKTGGGTPKTANPEYWSGNIPWIQSSDLVEGDIEHVNINKFINNNALKNSAAKLISRDSIALVTRVSVGKVAVINQDFTTSQDFLSLSDFDGSDIKFLAYQLYRLMQENAKVLQGTSIKGITKTELIEQSISIPSSSEEQNLISNVLSKIDSIITLHQQEPFLYGNSVNYGVKLC